MEQGMPNLGGTMKTLDSLRLTDIVTRHVLGVGPDSPLLAAARRMGEMRVSCIVVLDGELPTGIITEKDLVQLLSRRPRSGMRVGDVIRSPIVTAPADVDVRTAYGLLRRHGIRHLIAVDANGGLAGVATTTDFRLHLGLDRLHRSVDLDACLDPAMSLLARDASLAEALEQMMRDHKGYVLIAENGKPLGILTERDIPLLLAAEVDPGEVRLHEAMSTPVHTILRTATLAEAIARMAKLRIRHIAVIDENHFLTGMLSQDSLMETLGIDLFGGHYQPPEIMPEKPDDPIRDILEHTETAALSYDASGDRMRITSPLQRLLGYPENWQPDGLAGWLALIHPDDQNVLPEYLRLQNGAASRNVHEESCRLRTVNGEWLRVRIRSTAPPTSDGRAHAVFGLLATLSA